jgi:hypothetical protein
MRELVESIKKFYLGEGSGKPSSPIEYDDNDDSRSTKLTNYSHKSRFQPPNRYSPDYSGVTHTVEWKNKHSKNNLTPSDKMKTLADAKHLHHDFIDKSTKVGDVVKNIPVDDSIGGGNKRSRIYKKQGFGNLDNMYSQYGIVKQHPDEHPDESSRGKKYLHPLEPSDIDAHGKNPSKGGDKDEVRHIKDSYNGRHTRVNDSIHTFKRNIPISANSFESSHDNNSNISNADKSFQTGKEHYLKPGDTITRSLPTIRNNAIGSTKPRHGLRSVSLGHMMGFPAPKDYQQTGVVQKDSKYLKAKD